jgi:hypothetical protein
MSGDPEQEYFAHRELYYSGLRLALGKEAAGGAASLGSEPSRLPL